MGPWNRVIGGLVPTNRIATGECGTFPYGPPLTPPKICPSFMTFMSSVISSSVGADTAMSMTGDPDSTSLPHSFTACTSRGNMDAISAQSIDGSGSPYERTKIVFPSRGFDSFLNAAGFNIEGADTIIWIWPNLPSMALARSDTALIFSLASAVFSPTASTFVPAAVALSTAAPEAASALPAAFAAASAESFAVPALKMALPRICSSWARTAVSVCADRYSKRPSPPIPATTINTASHWYAFRERITHLRGVRERLRVFTTCVGRRFRGLSSPLSRQQTE